MSYWLFALWDGNRALLGSLRLGLGTSLFPGGPAPQSPRGSLRSGFVRRTLRANAVSLEGVEGGPYKRPSDASHGGSGGLPPGKKALGRAERSVPGGLGRTSPWKNAYEVYMRMFYLFCVAFSLDLMNNLVICLFCNDALL
jgi:hypothetical protein